MSFIRIDSIKIQNYRSFGPEEQTFVFPDNSYDKPIAIVGYNNCGKTNLINAILYGIGEKFISENTFEIGDFYNLNSENEINITTNLSGSSYTIRSEQYQRDLTKSISGEHKAKVKIEESEIKAKMEPSFFGANKHYNIFYINFHNIKDEISIQKSSRGSLKSFLAKHIKQIVDNDEIMKAKKETFEQEISNSTSTILAGSKLNDFIRSIKRNYNKNLRDNNCEINFGLPKYEDIFLQMMFKIGLNGNRSNMVPIDHFGDGYISMFVMAVIQAIAESNSSDKCLFLFEEPESFLHENHQEYFYKTVLCGLSKKGHQVIYTTHSDKMIDIFDTKGLIRLEMDENNQTINKYNNKSTTIDNTINIEGTPINLDTYNSFIKTIEPNLNRILFSKKAILVEGPNDVMVYKHIIKRKVLEKIENREDISNKEKYADTYLNFNNIVIIPHYGKITALLLIKLCKHINLDYFIVNDRDFEEDFFNELSEFETEEEMKTSGRYISYNRDEKAQMTTNWKLIKEALNNKIHFNVSKLEQVIGYEASDKNSRKIWTKINTIDSFNSNIFPDNLLNFLEINNILEETPIIEEETPEIIKELEIKTEEIEKQIQPTKSESKDDEKLPF